MTEFSDLSLTLRTLIDAAEGPVFSVDARCRYTSFNDAHATTMKALYGADIRLGHSLLEYQTVDEDRRTAQANLERALRGERVVEEAFSGEDVRTRRRFRVTHDPVRDGGSIIGVAVRALDVTETQRAEGTNARLAAIVESSDDAIISKSLEGTIVTWNRGAERIYGYTADEIIGRSVAMLTPDGYENESATLVERIRGGALVEHYETVRMRKDGSLVDVSLSASPVKDAAGTIVGDSTIARDITERKRIDTAIRGLNGELEERVLVGTAQLKESSKENDELVDEAVVLTDANAAITRIAATDALTGLPNRRHFDEALETSISFARRHRSSLSVASLDLDGLKGVNDIAGHEAGDGVLTSFASLLVGLCRAEDLPARLGGDEFSVLLPGIALDGARGLAERVLAAVRSCAALADRGVTVSAGVAAWRPDERSSGLLRRADEALYDAKRGGGDSIAARD